MKKNLGQIEFSVQNLIWVMVWMQVERGFSLFFLKFCAVIIDNFSKFYYIYATFWNIKNGQKLRRKLKNNIGWTSNQSQNRNSISQLTNSVSKNQSIHSSKFSKRNYNLPLHSLKLVTYFCQISLFKHEFTRCF